MSADRKFTLNLRQNNTGKTASIVITQYGKAFVPKYVFEVDKTNYNLSSDGGTITINYTSYKTTENGGREPIKISYYINHGSNANEFTPNANGIGSFDVKIPKNTSYNKYVVIITVRQSSYAVDDIIIEVHVAARPDDGVFTAYPTTLSYSSDGETKTSTIRSTSKGKTVGWSVMDKSSVPDWVTYSGEGTGTLSVTTKAYK